MAEQRPFRFRLPWLSAATAPAPPPPRPTAPAPPRPAAQAPAQPTTTAFPSQRPPFRPAGIAPPQPTPQATRTEFPSQADTQPRAASLPPSPPPSRFAFRTTGQTSSQPSSPMRRATQVQSTVTAVSQPPSPPKKTQPVTQETSRPPLNVIQSPSSIPREQQLKPAATLQPSQEQQTKTQIKSEIVSESQYRIPRETTFKPDRVAVQPTQASAVALQKLESKAGHPLSPSESEKSYKKTEDKKAVEELVKEGISGDQKKVTHLKDRERAPLHKEIRGDFLKFAHKLALGHPKQPTDGKPVSIITVAGENRGASMHVGSESAKKDGSVPIHRGYKINSSEIPESTTTDGEGSSKERIPRDHKTKKDQATRTYVNSNSQSINNSILFSSSVTERNPGVQLASYHNPAEAIKSTTESDSFDTRKAQFSVTPAENLTYQPTVRRRCLRGLFLEPSDSDPDNPDKPRRHGCLYKCGEKSKDQEIGVL